jgi:hypothetical protein
MNRIRIFAILTLLVGYSSLFAASLQDSILEIPRGAEFKLRNELEIPANRNFIVLGFNKLSETFNELNKGYNQQNGTLYTNQGYYYYNDFLNFWMKTADQSYQECIERNRVVYSYGGTSSSTNNTIINQGHGNTNIIVNQGIQTAPSYGSYIADNSCIMPEHSAALLMLDKNNAGSGGLFREGYVFKVISVKHEVRGVFHIVTIRFDHNVAKGIQIVTTSSPEKISMSMLQYREVGDSFLQGVASALGGMIDIGGDNFTIELPGLRYYN